MRSFLPTMPARTTALALLLSGCFLIMPALASAHVIWTNPAPRAETLNSDTTSPCGGRLAAPIGTSPARYAPGAEIGVFFREDVGHSLNFSTDRAFFTINFSPGGGSGFTELARVPVSSAQLPRFYGNVVVGGLGAVPVKLPTTLTEQGTLQLVYNTTDGTANHFSCADIRIAPATPPPPPPLDVLLQPGLLGDVFEISVGTHNRTTGTLTGLTSLVLGGLRITTDVYPADKRADVGLVAGPTPQIGGSLAPSERRDHLLLLEARSPGFAIAVTQARATGVGGATHEDTALGEIEIARRVPTLLDLWAMASGGLMEIFDGAQRDFRVASTRMTNAFYRSLPKWKLEFRDAKPNVLERALAHQIGVDPKMLAWLPDDPVEALRLFAEFEVARGKGMGRTLKKHAGTAYNVALKTPFEFWTDPNARARMGPELTAGALEFGAVRDAYLGEAESFWTTPGKISDARAQLPAIANEALAGSRALYEKSVTAGANQAASFGRTLVNNPRRAAQQLGDGVGVIQGEIAYALAENAVGGKFAQALGAISKARRTAPAVALVTKLDDLKPAAGATRTLKNPGVLGMTDEHAALIQREVVAPINAKFGINAEVQFRPTNSFSQSVKGSVGKVEPVKPKNIDTEDLVLGCDSRALGQAAIYRPKLPANLNRWPGPQRDQLKARYADKLKEYNAYTGVIKDAKMIEMRKALKSGGHTFTERGGGRVTKLEMELGEVRYGKTIALTYKKLIVNGDTLVKKGSRPRPIGSDYDLHAFIDKATGGHLPAGIRGQAELELMDRMRKLARDRGIPFGFHGATHNGFDLARADYRYLLKYMLMHLSEADARRVATRYAGSFGTSPDEFLSQVAKFDQFVVKISGSGVTTGPGVIPL